MLTGLRYGLAAAAAGAALAIVAVLHPVLDAGSHMVFLAAVVAAAVFAGMWPALVTTALSIAAIDYFFLAPVHSLTLLAKTDAALLALFGGVAILTSWLTGLLHRRRARLEEEALRAAGLADLFHRQAEELARDVDALHALRQPPPRKSPPG